MLLSKGSVKLRSLAMSSFLLALTAGVAGAATTGCFFVGDHHHDDDTPDVDDPTPPDTVTVSEVAIQPDRVLEAAPGEGVGIFVEYLTGGHWRVWTTCDTFTSKQVCAFTLFASTRVSEDLLSFGAEDVEGFDKLVRLDDGSVQLIAETDSDVDVLTLDVTDGQPLDLEVYIDGQSAQPYVYWVSGDVIHGGAPANPIRFVPQAPPDQG